MAIMETEVVILSKEPGPVADVVINRPEHLNALNSDVLQSLLMVIEKLSKNPEILVMKLTGSGEKAFVAGADIAVLNQLGKRAASDYLELGQRVMRAIETARFPVIAAVNGYALGGGLELALACDIIVASQSARFGAPEVNLGIIPGFGGTQRLIQRCGIGAAKRLVLTGEMVAAEEALRMGLADKVAAEGQLHGEVEKLCNMIVAKGPLAVREAKQLLVRSQEYQLLSGLQLEVESFLKVFDTHDREEGMTAFLQKRTPKFLGK